MIFQSIDYEKSTFDVYRFVADGSDVAVRPDCIFVGDYTR